MAGWNGRPQCVNRVPFFCINADPTFNAIGPLRVWITTMPMTSSTILQIVGIACAGLAVIVFLWPLQRVLSEYSRMYLSDDRWAVPVLYTLVPLWLLLMTALLCMTASGGFDWLRLGRPALYVLTIATTLSLAAATFVFVGLYIRPGMTSRALYYPFICAVPLTTLLLVLLSINPGLKSGSAPGWLRLPWAIFAALSMAACIVFAGNWLIRNGEAGLAMFAQIFVQLAGSSQEELDAVAEMDPDRDFDSLLLRANSEASNAMREAATARLRSHPEFLERLVTELETGYVEPAVAFVCDAELTAAELKQLARPSFNAMERWVNRIPAPNYTTASNRRKLRRWGAKMLNALSAKLAGTGVDFAPLLEEFEFKVESVN